MHQEVVVAIFQERWSFDKCNECLGTGYLYNKENKRITCQNCSGSGKSKGRRTGYRRVYKKGRIVVITYCAPDFGKSPYFHYEVFLEHKRAPSCDVVVGRAEDKIALTLPEAKEKKIQP